ncbi:STAS domain-containing protein [Dactylosporangium sp. CS-047395]|uniref:STAS domain-containing protein n=1 Tax=Dactylosporangium sp. CS-047395 TaxID=3239936 RepID=UPI003D9447A4
MRSSFIGNPAGGNPADQVTVHVLGGDPLVVCVAGRLLFDTLSPLTEALAELDPAEHPRLVLDLGQVPMCDSSALNLMVRTRAALLDAGGWLRLAAVQPMVGSVLKLTNLSWILPSFRTAEEAAAHT